MNEEELRAAGIHPQIQRHRKRLADRIDADEASYKLQDPFDAGTELPEGRAPLVRVEHHNVFRQYGGGSAESEGK